MAERVNCYAGVTVTLPDHGQAYKLIDLILAIDPTIPGSCRELNIQFDPTGGSGAILVGDCKVEDSPQRCSYSMEPGGSLHYGAGASGSQVNLTNIWVLSTSMDDALVNVEIQN